MQAIAQASATQFSGVYRCLPWRQVLRRGDVLAKEGLGLAPTKSWLALITQKLTKAAGLKPTPSGTAPLGWHGFTDGKGQKQWLFLTDDHHGSHFTQAGESTSSNETLIAFMKNVEHWAKNPHGYFLIPPFKRISSRFIRLFIVPKPIHQWIEKRLTNNLAKGS